MVIDLAVDVELPAIRELAFVAVGRSGQQQDGAAGRHEVTVMGDVRGDEASLHR